MTVVTAPAAARIRTALTHVLGIVLAVSVVAQVVGSAAAGADLNVVVPSTLLYGATVATGWLLAVRVPGNTVGWALVFVGSVLLAGGITQALGDAFRVTSPRFAGWMYWFSGDHDNAWTWAPAVFTLLIWIPLHFPDGALPSRGWRWLSWTSLALLVYSSVVFAAVMGDPWGMPNPTAVPLAKQHTGELLLLSSFLALLCFAGAVASLVARYRRGDQVLRAQLRWVLWAVALATTTLAASWLLPPGPSYLDSWGLGMYALIPISIGVAVLRYHLYDIDRIISRTAAYAVVTLVVVGTYAVVVLAASLALPRLPSVGVALATLAAAAVFLPALRRIRRGVDRVFDRAQYDAQRVVDAFGERMRTGADPQGAAVDLAAAIEQTLQPSSIGIWTRP